MGSILVGVHKTGLHFQLLIQVTGVQAEMKYELVGLGFVRLRVKVRKIMGHFSYIGYFHKNTTMALLELVIL